MEKRSTIRAPLDRSSVRSHARAIYIGPERPANRSRCVIWGIGEFRPEMFFQSNQILDSDLPCGVSSGRPAKRLKCDSTAW
jgi:hypothetical protein